ncbi:MAG: calcium/proton exchanger, partial [Aestuariivirga sp.]
MQNSTGIVGVAKPLYLLLLFIPISVILKYLASASPFWIFVTAAAAITVLAEWIRRATEQLAERVGPASGGLLTVTFGSIAEFVLALFVLASGEVTVVQAQITGSIIGTSLFGLGLAIVVGGVTRERQTFGMEKAGLLSTLLLLVVIALLLPAVFDYAGRAGTHAYDLGIADEDLSLGASVVLIMLYFANLAYTLITHRDVFAAGEVRDKASWSLWTCLLIIIGATGIIALEAEMVSAELTETAKITHLPPLFLGVIVLGLLGTVADLFAASWFAHEDKMGLVLSICIGSAIQVGLVVAPLLVIISWLMGHPMNLVFSDPLHLFAIAATAFIVNAIARDGETTWFEGVLLLGV